MRKLAVLIVVAFALSGCKIFTVLDRDDLGGSFFEAVDVEKMPDGGYLAVGCGFDSSWGGVGIVVTRPDGEHERFFPGCQGWLDASPAPDGTIYFSWQEDPTFHEDPFSTIVALDPDTRHSETVFTFDRAISAVTYAPDGRLLFGARDVTADPGGVFRYRIHKVTGATTSVPVAGTVDLGGNHFAVDADGTIFATASTLNSGSSGKVFTVTTSGTRTVIAGTGAQGFSGDGGPATAATFRAISDVDVNSAGEVFVVDAGNQRVRVIDTHGTITTIAGGGDDEESEGILATRALIPFPTGVAVDHDRNFWVSDAGDLRVRYVGQSPP